MSEIRTAVQQKYGSFAASVATALVSGRHALSGGPVRAVREDW